MYTLVVVRHAKSSWQDPGLRDHERPLNERGRRDAPFMAGLLAEQLERPDLIVSSPAVRARTTAAIFAEACDYNTEDIALDSRVYEATTEDLVEVIRSFPESARRALLFGHNPGMTELINTVGRVRLDNLPTCGLAVFQSRSPWPSFGLDSPELLALDYPKKHVDRPRKDPSP